MHVRPGALRFAPFRTKLRTRTGPHGTVVTLVDPTRDMGRTSPFFPKDLPSGYVGAGADEPLGFGDSTERWSIRNKELTRMGLFTKKPVLPDYTGMSVEERLKDPAWYSVVSSVPGFHEATLVTNADRGHIINMMMGGLTQVHAGIFTVTPERVAWAYAEKHEISQATRSVESAQLSHKGDMFIVMFGRPEDSWGIYSDDHQSFLQAFQKARGYFG